MKLTAEEQEDMRVGEIIDSIIEKDLLEVRYECGIKGLMVIYKLDQTHAEELRETIASELGLIE